MSDPNKRKFWWFWAAWGVVFVIIEVYAIITKEVLVTTLTRTFWWLVIHFTGECALEVC